MTTGTILQKIVETKRPEVAEARQARPDSALLAEIEQTAPPRDFYGSLASGGPKVRLIAEIKRASPSAGLIRAGFDPVEIARTYERAGAAALSVLTDRTFFQGELQHLTAARQAVSLPVLRKDFIIDEYQILESRAAGADAVLLIAAILSPAQIRAYSDRACGLGMTSLIEVHDARQLSDVRDLIAPDRRSLLGINNRDLRTQTTDLDLTMRLAPQVDPGVPFVSESGIKNHEDVRRLQETGVAALLIGETFMRAPDIGAKVRELMGWD